MKIEGEFSKYSKIYFAENDLPDDYNTLPGGDASLLMRLSK